MTLFPILEMCFMKVMKETLSCYLPRNFAAEMMEKVSVSSTVLVHAEHLVGLPVQIHAVTLCRKSTGLMHLKKVRQAVAKTNTFGTSSLIREKPMRIGQVS